MVKIEIKYDGQLRCIAVHTPSGCELKTDAPVDNQGKGESFSPTDLVATALGSCIATVMAIAARKHDIDPVGMTVTVEKFMSTDAPRRIVRLPVLVSVPTSLTEKQRVILENAGRHCPVHKSLHPDIDAPIEFHFVS